MYFNKFPIGSIDNIDYMKNINLSLIDLQKNLMYRRCDIHSSISILHSLGNKYFKKQIDRSMMDEADIPDLEHESSSISLRSEDDASLPKNNV